MASNEAHDLPPGMITVTPARSGFFLVQIGRVKYTKRFNLTRTEAQELIEELSSLLTAAPRG